MTGLALVQTTAAAGTAAASTTVATPVAGDVAKFASAMLTPAPARQGRDRPAAGDLRTGKEMPWPTRASTAVHNRLKYMRKASKTDALCM